MSLRDLRGNVTTRSRTTVSGTFGQAVGTLLATLSRRTYGDPSQFPLYAESLKANPFSVLWTYLSQDTAIAVLGLRFLDLIVIFAAFTLIYLLLDKRQKGQLRGRDRGYALVVATWFSLLSPLTWFLLFKGQAYVHTHTNYLAWHMPFTLFGFALCGLVLQSLIPARNP